MQNYILKKKIDTYKRLKEQGLNDNDAGEIAEISRATYYRRLKNPKLKSKRPKNLRTSGIPTSTRDLILQLRRENPTYGKAKIAVILLRDFAIKLSESSVGRILKQLKDNRLIETSVSYPRRKRGRKFSGHAQKYDPKLSVKMPGDLVQIDHMSAQHKGLKIKQFIAWDKVSKVIATDVKDDATSGSAANFLDSIIAKMPFKIKRIQVDGGSEFMNQFEKKCQERGIILMVLPPRRPQYNGGVERTNRTFREEFYHHKTHSKTLLEIRKKLQAAEFKHNSYRPHHSLQGLTPMLYCQKLTETLDQKKSHMY